MPEITGKTIYILGAGASVHVGAPLLADFLVTARLLRDGRQQLVNKDSFDRVFEWIDKLRGSSYYVEFDLDNLEHVFSLAEMGKQLKLEEAEQIFADLRYLVTETLDIRRITYTNERLVPSAEYAEFVKLLHKFNEDRQRLVRDQFHKDVVISFNYDVSLDYAFNFSGIGFSYGFEEATNFLLLKLHGSTNWGMCRACKADLQIVPASPIPSGHHPDPFLKAGRAYSFKMVTSVLAKTVCKGCDTIGNLEPY
jgi:hypothetical protein